MQPMTTSEKGTYIVMKQPMSLDRLSVHDVSQHEATGKFYICYQCILSLGSK